MQTIYLDIVPYTSYQRLMLQGVINYVHHHRPNWRFTFDHWPANDRALRIRGLKKVDGVITHLAFGAALEAIEALKVPVVLIEQDPASVQFPIVNANNEKIARMAFDHLRDKGIRRYGFSATSNVWPAIQRRIAFERIVAEEGMGPVHSFQVDPTHRPMEDISRRALRDWVEALPKPIGFFCSSIGEAWRMVEACNELGIHVPDEVAVVGCDKDQLTPNLTQPPLSSIDHGMEQAGYEAATLLQRLLNGESPPSKPILVDPVGVIQRQSSDVLAIDDPNVLDAVRFIRENSIHGIAPADVVDHVLIGRRRLEIRFKEVVGRTIQQQIIHERVEHARHLLAHTDLSLLEVAQRSSFNHVSRLSEAFSRILHTSPSAYRRSAKGLAQ